MEPQQVGDEQAHPTTDGAANMADTEENMITISDEKVTPKKSRKNTGSLNVTLEDLKPHFGKKLKLGEKDFGASKSTIKRACRELGITRWPSNDNYKKNPELYFQKAHISEFVGTSKRPISNGPNHSTENFRVVPQNAAEATIKHTQTVATTIESDNVVVKAIFEGGIIIVPLSRYASLEELTEEIAKRHKLRSGSFYLEYRDDEGDWILLDCDDALQLCMKTLRSFGKTPIRIRVQSINK